MLIKQATTLDLASWLSLRKLLWPNITNSEHQYEMKDIFQQPEKMASFIAWENGMPIGFAEVNLRYDYVAGCTTIPVTYLEGIFVVANKRKQGIARMLCGKVEEWGKAKGCNELASDVELDNLVSQQVHQALSFQEVERVVCYYKKIK